MINSYLWCPEQNHQNGFLLLSNAFIYNLLLAYYKNSAKF